MINVGEISYIPNNKQVVFSGDKQVIAKTEPLPADSVEISSKTPKGKEKGGIGSVATFLGAISVAVAGATFGGIKIYNKFFQKLACGIKKGEIDDALFNFIKKSDPKGKLFNNAETIKNINANLTDDNLLILKQLSKMKRPNNYAYRAGDTDNRFYLVEMSDLLKNTNESNIKYLEQLANKSEDIYGSQQFLETSSMIDILKNINTDNKKVAGSLIDIMKIKDRGYITLSDVLKDINKDNIDTYQLLINTRKKGKITSLELNDLKTLAKTLSDTKNPKCAEFLLNIEKDNGTGAYKYSIEELQKLLKETSDDKIDVYKKIFELKSVKSISTKNLNYILANVNEHNAELLDKILNKKNEFGSCVFRDYNQIGDLLRCIDKDSKGIAEQLIDSADSTTEYFYDCSKNEHIERKADECIKEILTTIKVFPQREKELKQIIANGQANSDKFNLKEIYKKFYNITSW